MTLAVARGPSRKAAHASSGTVRYSKAKRPPNTTPATTSVTIRRRPALENLRASPAIPRAARPHEQERRDDQRAGSISQPPCGPDGREVCPVRKPCERQAGDAYCRTNCRAQERRKEREPKDVGRAAKRVPAVGERVDKVGPDQAFQSVPASNGERRRHGTGGRQVGEKRAEEDPGHALKPKSSSAARAIPVGGHTAVALAFTKASFSPALAATKYTTARMPLTMNA